MRTALSLFYRQCEVVLSPSPAADDSLAALGVERDRIGRWARGVDLGLYDPAKGDPDAYPGEIKVLYAGRLTKEKGVDLLADGFLRARASAIRASTCCSPAAGRRRTRCASGSATPRRSSAGSTASSSPTPTPAPTCSSSARRPTPTAR